MGILVLFGTVLAQFLPLPMLPKPEGRLTFPGKQSSPVIFGLDTEEEMMRGIPPKKQRPEVQMMLGISAAMLS